ncbi:FHA domain protein [gut metagenome]|uniref:FHA domain protein n=1 Tax=gut metagenome TaxID=749906 RepID=J9FHU1_9ZZZZ
MKRIRCPKCDEVITFDETLYEPGRTLVFDCPSCHKQFKIRVAPLKEEEEEPQCYGKLVVIENAFHYKQEIPLYLGENVVGRYVKGTKANAAIKTVDPSIDTTHCVITVKDKKGKVTFTLRDAPSCTGTFLMNTILGPKEQVLLEEGAIITIGATTMILRLHDEEDEA